MKVKSCKALFVYSDGQEVKPAGFRSSRKSKHAEACMGETTASSTEAGHARDELSKQRKQAPGSGLPSCKRVQVCSGLSYGVVEKQK